MSTTETEPVPAAGTVRPRLPHVAGVLTVVALLAGIVVLWSGSFADRNSPAGSVRAEAIPAGDRRSTVTMSPSVVRTAAARSDESRGATQSASPPSMLEPTQSDTQQPDFGQAILGTWKQYSYGHRTLHVTNGGKATIDVKLDGLSAIAFGEKLHLDIEWTIDGRTLLFNTTGGTPKASINAVKSLYGDNRVYEILEINEKQMLLKEGDEEKTPWDRVTDDESTPPD